MSVLNLFRLTDRTAIVTGAGRGIGKAIALALAEAGADVVVTARTVAEIEATAAEIRVTGRKSLAIPADVRESNQVANLIDRTVSEFGHLDIMVNGAGGTFYSPALELSEKGWDAIIRENLKSAFLCCRAAGQVMAKQKTGCIINISSISGLGPYPSGAHYGASKAAIVSLTQTLAMELAPYNIRVNAIAPATVITEGVAQIFKEHPEIMEQRIRLVPLKRLGYPQDVAAAAVYLASDAASYITGEVLMLRGGLRTAVG